MSAGATDGRDGASWPPAPADVTTIAVFDVEQGALVPHGRLDAPQRTRRFRVPGRHARAFLAVAVGVVLGVFLAVWELSRESGWWSAPPRHREVDTSTRPTQLPGEGDAAGRVALAPDASPAPPPARVSSEGRELATRRIPGASAPRGGTQTGASAGAADAAAPRRTTPPASSPPRLLTRTMPRRVPAPFPLPADTSVTLRLAIDERGVVTDARVLESGASYMSEPMRRAALQWRYAPARRGGVAVPSTDVVRVRLP